MKTIIFDIDGTLADIEHRRHHVASRPKNWPAFFEHMDKDPPNNDVVALCQNFIMQRVSDRTAKYKIVFCSGRGEEHRRVTEDWLIKHVWPYMLRNSTSSLHFPDDHYLDLRMRPARDNRPDDIIKREMLEKLRAEGHDIWFVVDDRQRVVDMWRAQGITCLQCAPGDFDKADTWEYQVQGGECFLSLLVGPSGAGKTTYADMWAKAEAERFSPESILSSDAIRARMCGDFRDQSQNARVFAYMHDTVKTRMRYGLHTVVDATNLHRKDRLAFTLLATPGTKVAYFVIDRPLDQKLRDGGWRLNVVKDGKNLIERHHEAFKSALPDILKGDGLDNVIVHDRRIT